MTGEFYFKYQSGGITAKLVPNSEGKVDLEINNEAWMEFASFDEAFGMMDRFNWPPGPFQPPHDKNDWTMVYIPGRG